MTGTDAHPSSPAFFEAKYRLEDDPWAFSTSPYELERYAAILRAVGTSPVRRAFEPGCSIGVLTALVAPLCDELIATDAASSAIERARRRCAAHGHVHFAAAPLPELPAGPFDLVLFNEIGYYFAADQLVDLVERIAGIVTVGGRIVASHWTGTSPDHQLAGSTVHEIVTADRHLRSDVQLTEESYVLGTWTRIEPDGASEDGDARHRPSRGRR